MAAALRDGTIESQTLRSQDHQPLLAAPEPGARLDSVSSQGSTATVITRLSSALVIKRQ